MDAQTVEKRGEICQTCEHQRFIVCALCGCVIPAKIRLENQKCPAGKW